MSTNERPDVAAIRELELLVRHLGEELAGFRKRALVAEARLKEISSTEGGAAGVEAISRASRLTAENATLRAQLTSAQARAKGMLDRVRFLRQQSQAGGGEK